MSNHKYTVEEVINFCQNNPIYIVDRLDGKNKRFIREVKMSIDETIGEIRNLRKEFLFRGPFIDRDIQSNYLYEFHKHVRGKWCYIKLTIDDKKNVVVRVISFHESEVAIMLDKNKEYMGYCPEEEDLVPGYIIDGETEHVVAGVKVIAPSFHLACKKCGAWLSNNEIERENDICIYDAYKKKVGLLTTYQIKEIRAKRGMSQRQLAKFLDIGEKDITRYENGSVQTRSIDNMIRLVGDDTAYACMCSCLNKNTNSKK